MDRASTAREIAQYFEYSNHGIEVVEDGLMAVSFGEYLVEKNAITRYQLLRALQRQDQQPDVPNGECLAAMGFMRWDEVKEELARWKKLDELVV